MKGFSLLEFILLLLFISSLTAASILISKPNLGHIIARLKAEVDYCSLLAQISGEKTSINFSSDFASTCKGKLELPKRTSFSSTKFGLSGENLTLYPDGSASPGRIELGFLDNQLCNIFISRAGLIRDDC